MFVDYLWAAPVLLILVVLLVTLLQVRVGLRFRRAIRDAGDELELTWSPRGILAPGLAEGTRDGLTIAIYTAKQGIGSFSRLLTIVEVDLDPSLPVTFELAKEHFLNKLSHMAGQHDIEFDDREFDAIYRVGGPDPDAVRALFNADARDALVVMARGASDLYVNPHRIRWERAGRVLEPKTLVRVARAGVAAARALRRT